ncbi:hypothetical protein P9703_14010 [Bacillus subtilis]|nr:hypothetical protein [Bacillus subtilis]
MPKSVTLYDLLISCPSDVKEELKIINEAVDDFNRMFGHANNATINTKHWSKDSYPQSGGRPQELLNQQFVLDCDAAVAVFWTRFGTPTDSYGSGTEEEIEELIKSDKQVFLYFCEKPINPSEIDFEQYQKIQQFKERYGKSNIYDTFTSTEDFKKKFLNHLSLHFLKQFEKGGEELKTSELSINSVFNGKITDKTKILVSNYSNCELIKSKTNEIINNIQDIEKIHLKDNKQKENQNSKFNYSFPLIDYDLKEVKIDEDIREKICNFARNHSLEIEEDSFFDLGELKQKRSQVFPNSYSQVGSKDAKEKFKMITQLYDNINMYNQWVNYFNNLDSKHYLRLCLSNTGTQYDEDIDVKLFFKEGLLCKPEDIPIPETDIIEMCENSILPGLKGEKSLSIIPYSDYPIPSINTFVPYRTYQEKAKQLRNKFLDTLNNIFIYEYYNEDGFDIIVYNQSYLKQKSNVHLPSILIFNSPPEEIRYEIQSKYLPDTVTGEIEIKKR